MIECELRHRGVSNGNGWEMKIDGIDTDKLRRRNGDTIYNFAGWNWKEAIAIYKTSTLNKPLLYCQIITKHSTNLNTKETHI